jgi:mannose-6-phosphate isomerase
MWTPTLLSGEVRTYAWGSTTAIPDLLGEPNLEGEPWAELWFGAHPALPSRLDFGGERVGLDALIARHPAELLGARVLNEFGPRLPFLLKLLAAARPLSIQCHPSVAQAQAGFAREDAAGLPLDDPRRSFKDRSHKPELVAALGPFLALDGFRPIPEVIALFSGLGASMLAEPLRALERAPDSRGLGRFFAALMNADAPRRAAWVEEAVERARPLAATSPAHAWVVRLAELYPRDVGALAPLLFNLVELEPDEALYLASGEPHAYLQGLGVELMANSDNVIRGGLTAKHVDVPLLLETLTFEARPAGPLRPAGSTSGGWRTYRTPARELELSFLDLDGSEPGPPREALEVLLVTRGRCAILSPGQAPLELAAGRAAMVPAQAPAYRLSGRGRVYRATVPGR